MSVKIDQTTDAKTGELIKKAPIPKELQEIIDQKLTTHSQFLGEFTALSMSLCETNIKWIECRKKIKDSDSSIREKMTFICKALGLNEHEPWTYNMSEKCFELREPPELEPVLGSSVL